MPALLQDFIKRDLVSKLSTVEDSLSHIRDLIKDEEKLAVIQQIPVKLSARFGSVHSCVHAGFSLTRFANSPILQATSSSAFNRIIVMPSNDNIHSVIILTGYTKDISSGNVYEDVSMALQAMQEPSEVPQLYLP